MGPAAPRRRPVALGGRRRRRPAVPRRRPAPAPRARRGRRCRVAPRGGSPPPGRDRRTKAAATTTAAAVATAAARPGPRRRAVTASTRTPPRGRRRAVQTRDPRQRARRTVRARRSALATRFAAGQPRMRLLFTLVVMLLFLMAVLFKVGLLQTFQGDALRSAAAKQWTRERTLPAQRGAIFDRNGDELALSVPAATIAVNPKLVERSGGHGRDARPACSTSPTERQAELAAAMAAKDDAASSTSPARSTPAIGRPARRRWSWPACRRRPRGPPDAARGRHRPQRDRPHRHRRHRHRRARAAVRRHARRGTAGAATLRGRARRPLDRRQRADHRRSRCPATTWCSRSTARSSSPPSRRCSSRVGELGARGGQAIVMDTDTGEIIAMASVRIDDDTASYEVTSGNYRAVDAYEPGSVAKVITVAGGAQRGHRHARHDFDVPWRKQYTRDGDCLTDSHQHPDESLTVDADPRRVVEHRHDHACRETIGPREAVTTTCGRSASARRPRSTSPASRPASCKPWQDVGGTERVTVAYGQGVASTSIQLIAAVNAIANDGVYVAPEAGAGRPSTPTATVHRHGAVGDPRGGLARGRPSRCSTMMREVVCRGHGATRPRSTGLSIAGKTGTGYKAQADGTYFDDGRRHARTTPASSASSRPRTRR